jgi:hypothetical protein
MFPPNSESILLNYIKNIQGLTVWVGDPISPNVDRPITACVFDSANCSIDIPVESSDIYCHGASDFDYLANT